MIARYLGPRTAIPMLLAGVVAGSVVPAVGAGPGCALTAATSLRVARDARCAGDLGANETGGRVLLGSGTRLDDLTVLRGDSVGLRDGASVFDVEARTLVRSAGAAIRGRVGSPALPLEAPFCAIPAVECGSSDVDVAPFESRVLTPGSYGRLHVRDGAAVSLAPGSYAFCEIRTGRSALISVASGGPSAIAVAGDVRIGTGSALVVSSDTSPPALVVGGSRARIGSGAEIDAFVRAPGARFVLGSRSLLQGGACARTVSLGRDTAFACASSAPPTTVPTSTTTSTVATTTTLPATTSTSSSATTSSSTTTSTSTTSQSTSPSSSTTSTTAPTSTTGSVPTTSSTTSTTTTSTTTTSTTIIPLNCGNGRIDTGETCDDGNNGDNDTCPSDCRIAACSPLAATQRYVQLRFAPPEGGLVAGLTMLLDYPEGKVELPNNVVNGQVVTTSFPAGTISGTPTGASVSVNDLSSAGKGHAARITIGSTGALTPGQVMRIRFQDCSGAPAPVPAEFPCAVLVASDPFSNPVAGVSCFVVVE